MHTIFGLRRKPVYPYFFYPAVVYLERPTIDLLDHGAHLNPLYALKWHAYNLLQTFEADIYWVCFFEVRLLQASIRSTKSTTHSLDITA